MSLFFFNLLGLFNKKRSRNKGFKPQKPSQQLFQVLILEQVLAPSGSLIDVDGDGIPDSVTDLPDDWVVNLDAVDDSIAERPDTDNLAFSDVDISDTDSFTAETATLDWIDGDDWDDLSDDTSYLNYQLETDSSTDTGGDRSGFETEGIPILESAREDTTTESVFVERIVDADSLPDGKLPDEELKILPFLDAEDTRPDPTVGETDINVDSSDLGDKFSPEDVSEAPDRIGDDTTNESIETTVGDSVDSDRPEDITSDTDTPETIKDEWGSDSDDGQELALTTLSNLSPTFESGFGIVDETGQVSISFQFDGGAYQGELAIISLDGMDEFEPGSVDFMREAARRALSNSELGHVVIFDHTEGAQFSGILGTSDLEDYNSGEYKGIKTFSMRPGDTVGFMLVPNGTVQEVFDNPNADGALRPLFSMATANPNDAFHTGQLVDVVGDGINFAMEDLRVDTGSDRDYNDIIFQVDGVKMYAPKLADLVAPGNEWWYSEQGQRILAYSSEFDNPGKDVPGDATYPGLPTPEIPIPTVSQTTVDQGGNGFADSIGEVDETVEPNRGGALPNTPTQIKASLTGDVYDQVGSTDTTDFYQVSSTELVNTQISVLSGNTSVSIVTPEGEVLSQQVLSRGTHVLTVPEGVSGEVLLKFDTQNGADATYMLRGFESQAKEPFNIDLELGGELTASQQEIIQAAARSIESVIGQGLPNAIADGKIIDDVNFKISVTELDGADGALARTKIDFMRYGTLLPAQSITQFDVADIAELERSGKLFSVVQHEILHGLGFGNLWEAKGLVEYAGTPFARYTGENAVAAFEELGGVTDYINLETEGNGSADLHWNEGLFQDELMTRDLGFQTGEDAEVFSPMSAVTLAALADLGYQVNLNRATPNWGLLGGAPIKDEDLSEETREALERLKAEAADQNPGSGVPIMVPAVDPTTIAPEIWAHAERFDINGEYYDWELITVGHWTEGHTTWNYVLDRMTHPSKLDNRPPLERANDPRYWQFIVDRNRGFGVEVPELIWEGMQMYLPRWNENYEREQEEERKRREEELNRQLEEERKERERLEEIYRQSGSGGLDWFLAKPFPDFGPTAPYETSVRDVVGSQVPDDYFRFTLSRPGWVTIYLEDLLADADLYLYDSRNRLIGKAERDGVTDEKIIQNLTAGTYLVRVHSSDGLATDYNLKVRFDGLPSRTQIGTGNGNNRRPGVTFSDPRIRQIYDTALNNFATPERAKANARIEELERQKRSYEQELQQLLDQMNAEQRAKVHGALDDARHNGNVWVDNQANSAKGSIDSTADWILGQIDSKIPGWVYNTWGIGDALRNAKDNLKGAINGARNWLKEKVSWVQDRIKDAIWHFIEFLKNSYRTGGEINALIEQAANEMKRKIDGIVGGINNWVGEFKGKILGDLDWLRNVGAVGWNFYDGVAEPLANSIANGVKSAVSSVGSFANGAVDWIKPRTQKAVAAVVDAIFGDQTGHLYNLIHGVDQQIEATRTGLEQAIASASNRIANVVRNIESLLTDPEERRRVLDALFRRGYQTAEEAYNFVKEELPKIRLQIQEEIRLRLINGFEFSWSKPLPLPPPMPIFAGLVIYWIQPTELVHKATLKIGENSGLHLVDSETLRLSAENKFSFLSSNVSIDSDGNFTLDLGNDFLKMGGAINLLNGELEIFSSSGLNIPVIDTPSTKISLSGETSFNLKARINEIYRFQPEMVKNLALSTVESALLSLKERGLLIGKITSDAAQKMWEFISSPEFITTAFVVTAGAIVAVNWAAIATATGAAVAAIASFIAGLGLGFAGAPVLAVIALFVLLGFLLVENDNNAIA